MTRAMKDSGIEWIGEIPEDWKTNKIKYVASLSGRIGWQGLTSAEYCDEGAYLITGINFENGGINWDTCVHVPMSRWEEAEQIQISDGDLLITKDGTVGKTAIVKNMPGKASLNSGVLLISTNSSCNKGYLYWVLNSEIFWKWFNEINSGSSTIIHLYQYDFKEFSFPLPNLENQSRIASFIDSKCQEIDNVLAKTRYSIEEYKKLKQAIITKAVTKGLRDNRKMKDSGIEWIGEIPEEWNVMPSKFMFKNSDIKRYPDDEQLTSSQKHGIITQKKYMQLENAKIVFANKGVEDWKHVEPYDFIISLRSFQGGLEMSEITGCITWHYIVLKACINICNRYYKWLFKSTAYIKALQRTCNYIRDGQDLRYSNFIQVPLVVVPIEEQQEIADYIESKCSEIDNLISKKEQLITELEAYKKSLIYEYVTGKKEVNS